MARTRSVRIVFWMDGVTCRTNWFSDALAAKDWADKNLADEDYSMEDHR